ncbi:MAG: DUF2027 domain-containing protein [Bacteroidetes bacterium]|nr:DUF2027 domain-containing protein [Bacteroidota bacterium]
MNFKVGDKVKFLNESGGGVVSGIITPSLVKVMIEDGFEIPTSTGNLIRIDSTEAAGRFFEGKNLVELPDNMKEGGEDQSVPMERVTPLLRIATKKPTPSGIYLAYVPTNQKWLITGTLDIYLVNHTDCDVLYNFFLIENDLSYTGMDFDTIPPYSKLYLQSIDREEIRDWTQGTIQVLFFRETMKKVLLPASCTFAIRENKFLKEDNYVVSSFLEGRALLSTLVEMGKQGAISTSAVDKAQHNEPNLLSSREFREPPLIDKHKTAPGEAEVDLHIEELVASEEGLDPEHMLKIQLDYFFKCLESALSNNYHKVIFIHGVGNGTLKSEIKMNLDGYEGVQHQQASMAKYGVGAVEVKILHNR